MTRRTASGRPVHERTTDHLPSHSAYARFNKKVAVAITAKVGSMTAAYLFVLLAICSLPAVLDQTGWLGHPFPGWLIKPSLIALVAWVAQTFLQLVLLPIIIVGQNVQAEAADARAAKTFEDSEELVGQVAVALDRLDTHTAGGLTEVLEALRKLEP